ncbi:MAG: Rrf2 family transcriptional regulator [Dehalococcoidia bacterium]|nr:Rrf2 family transcriptional regulator [Dehalococcoidia bacterium]
MRLSTKGDYGVRALIDLAIYGGEGPVQRSEIARRQHVPESYLDHLLAQLRRDGFVRSTRGPGGGHELSRPAQEICLLHALESLEGSLAPLACLEETTDEHTVLCGQQWVWRDIYEETRRRLQAVSIADLAERERERIRSDATSYVI